MLDAAVIALRLLQYLTGSILFGSALFLSFIVPPGVAAQRWAMPMLASAAVTLSIAAMGGLLAQTIAMAGSVELGLSKESLQAMLEMSLGKAAVVRAIDASVAVPLLLLLSGGRPLWVLTGLLGAVAVAIFGWMGHGAASEGAGAQLHLWADIAHALLAALWIGALLGFVMLALSGADARSLRTALMRFSTVGVPLVALLAATGLVNSWFLVGPSNLRALVTTDYGRALSFKLMLFGAMLVLASLNRWRHTAAVAREGASSVALRASLITEALLAVIILALVAWFGMLEPPPS